MTNLRAKFISVDPLPEGTYRRMCFHYDRDHKYCPERSTVRASVRITYDNCCSDEPNCACGYYAEMNLCEAHARQYEGTEDDAKTA